jgi:putative PEP-CTERM system histidine kinase
LALTSRDELHPPPAAVLRYSNVKREGTYNPLPDYLLFDPTIWSYGFAAMIFSAFAVRLTLGWRGGAKAWAVMGAAVASTLWAGAVVAAVAFPRPELWWLARFFDAVRLGAWLAFLLLLLGGWNGFLAATRELISRPWRVAGVTALLIAAIMLPEDPPWHTGAPGRGATAVFLLLLAVSVVGLAITEQLYRRTAEDRRWAVKPLVIGLAGMFAFDLIMYAEAVLFTHLDPGMWAARGVTHAFVICFVAVATARNTTWTIDLHVSRGLVFQSTAVVIAGICLLVVAAAGYWVRRFGGGWGATLQIAFVFAAILCVAALLLSGSLRARLKVIINKNLFSYRYDYRSEWLRFTQVLGTNATGENLHKTIVTALANLVESMGGAIWLERDGAFRQVARVNMPETHVPEAVTSSLSMFLGRTGWVIQMDEIALVPDRYSTLTPPLWLTALKDAWLVIPLPNGDETIGFVVLARPRAPIEINWEVLDLLKTASRQAASYLAQYRANEALLEAEKFDAFNRMSAFVVHDLKNLVAQLALLLKNAERHRDNPEFQKDMLDTVANVVTRMNRLMLQLRTGEASAAKPRPIDVCEIVKRVLAAKREYHAAIDVRLEPDVLALAHAEQLERVIGHIVQNAIEATSESSAPIALRVYVDGECAVIEVADSGVGMTQGFIRERLFRPFQTTKPQGMGIGMNESLLYVSAIGGRIDVESTPNVGTCFRISLLLADTQTTADAFGVAV